MTKQIKIVGYDFRDGCRFQPGALKDADVVGKHLEFLRKHYKNELTPADVVNDARNRNSPLHSFFEWNDGAAAEQYRLSQARGLIRSVVAIYREKGKEDRRIEAFVHIGEAGAPHYRAVDHALRVKSTRQMVLRQAWREFQSWRNRYAQLDEFAQIFETADDVGKALSKRLKK